MPPAPEPEPTTDPAPAAAPPPPRHLFGTDAFAPREIAARVQDVGVAKARLPLLTLALLGVLAGAFIGLGSLMFTLVAADATLGFAAQGLLGGLAFSLGLVLVTVAGAELFTGNNPVAMAWAARRLSSGEVLRNWLVAGLANLVGAAGVALLAFRAGHGALCNVLVCMAVWMAMAGRSVVDKVVAVVFPITAFVAAGFEHSIANLYFFPLAVLLGAPITPAEMAANLVPVIAGNIVGGSVLVALVYWVIYLRPAR